MQLLADENIPGSAVVALRDAGHDVVWILTEAPGMADAEIFDWAIREGRVILTFDKDFGEIAARARVSGPCGVVLFRLALPSASLIGSTLNEIIASRSDWEGNFSVVDSNRIRTSPMSKLGL